MTAQRVESNQHTRRAEGPWDQFKDPSLLVFRAFRHASIRPKQRLDSNERMEFRETRSGAGGLRTGITSGYTTPARRGDDKIKSTQSRAQTCAMIAWRWGLDGA